MRTRSLLPASCLWLLLAGQARALDVVVGSLEVESHSSSVRTVSVDVWLELAAGEPAPRLSAFQAAVTLTGTSSLAVVSQVALPSGAHPAIITPNFTPDFAGTDGSTRGSAAAFLDAGSSAVTDGAGLMRLEIQITPGSSGVFALAIDPAPIAGTVLADPQGNSVSYGIVNGTLEILPPSAPAIPALPGPARLLLVSLLAGAVLLASSRIRAG
jgi:hypothetical protein